MPCARREDIGSLGDWPARRMTPHIGAMQRILVMGPPGSGKSTLARRLGRQLDVPVFHLDQAFWRAGWIEAPRGQFRAEVERLAALPAWVLDGNYTAALAPRLRAADTVVYLDVPSWTSVLRVTQRMPGDFGRVRPNSAPGCPERFDAGFLRFTWSWNRLHRPKVLAALDGFAGQVVTIRNGRPPLLH